MRWLFLIIGALAALAPAYWLGAASGRMAERNSAALRAELNYVKVAKASTEAFAKTLQRDLDAARVAAANAAEQAGENERAATEADQLAAQYRSELASRPAVASARGGQDGSAADNCALSPDDLRVLTPKAGNNPGAGVGDAARAPARPQPDRAGRRAAPRP